MGQIPFDHQMSYDFAAEFFRSSGGPLTNTLLLPDERVIETAEPTIELLLKRISAGLPAVMLYAQQQQDTWIIAAANQRELDQTMRYVRRFLLPTYAEFSPAGRHLPRIHAFDPAGNLLQQAGATLYPAGYYRLVSPASKRAFILKRLALWLNLEASRPTRQLETHHTYRSLADAFQAALTAANWTEAEQCLHEMQTLNLSTADNLAFLHIQLLAQQQNWSAIWQHPDFALLAKMRVPRAVRAALLTAFHHSELLPLEQAGKWAEALEVFKQARPRLGLLLTGRFGLTQAAVVQVFAYQAVLDTDHDGLADLRMVQDDQQMQECLDHLRTLLPPAKEESKQPTPDPQQQVRQALLLADYDTALGVARAIAQPLARATLLIEIAFHSGDVQVAEDALFAFWELEADVQQHLRQHEPRIPHYLNFLEQLVTPPPDTATPAITTWLAWFQLAQEHPESAHLAPALDQLAATQDEPCWSTEHVTSLNDMLLAFVTDAERINQPYARRAMQMLVNLFLQESEFPRADEAYDNLYETLYLGLLETQEPNVTTSMTLLRLVESLLANRPSRVHTLWQHLSTWFQQPVATLETNLLETFELLAEYGLSGGALTEWYRRWVEYLLSLPTSRDRASLETWLAFGTWMQTVPDLVSSLQQMLSEHVEQQTENLIEQLPDGYRIGIFSLRESSAQRVKELLKARNNTLDVRICSEKVLNDQAKSLAQHADLVVVAWRSVSHALTYGIEPFLQQAPVFPQSSGSTSMLRAIEERLRQEQLAQAA